jgi:putative heme degradation protein
VVFYCQNSSALLGSAGTYPEVWSTPCGGRACGGDLKFFLSCWSQAFVTIEQGSDDWHYSVEFLGAGGDVIHGICLTPESDLEALSSIRRRILSGRFRRMLDLPPVLKARPFFARGTCHSFQ